MANEVRLTLVGDSKSAEQALGRTAKAADDAGQDMQRTAARLDTFSDAADKAETRAQGFRDGLTGAQDAASSLGEISRGNLFEGLLLAGSGMADLASTGANFLGPTLKNMVTRLGAVRLALIGTAAAAALGVGAWLLFANQTGEADDKVQDFHKDLDLLIRTGQASGGLKRLFGDGTNAAVDMSEALSVLDKRIIETRDDFLRPIATDAQEEALADFKALDEALTAQIQSGADATVVYQQLAEAYGVTNIESAIQLGLLPGLADATADARDQSQLLAESVEATADEYRIASQELKTFADLLKAQTSPLFGWLDAQDQVTDAQTALNEAINEFGPESVQAEEAQLDLAKAQLDLVDATAALQDVNERELLPTLQQLRDDGHLTEESFLLLKEALEQTQGAVNNLNGSTIRLNFEQVWRNQFSGAQSAGGKQFGGAAFSVLHDGGVVPGPAGQEVLAILQAGERVIPLDGAGGGVSITIDSGGSRLDDLLVQLLARAVRAAGGSVQTALGH